MMNKESPPHEKIKKAVSFNENDTKVELRNKDKKPGFGLLQFLTLRIIFIDLFVQLGDLGSDVAQGK